MTESKPKLIAVLRRFVLRLMPMLLVLGSTALGDSAAFDLPGPRIEVKVTRGGKTLPIFESVTTRSHHLFGFHLLEVTDQIGSWSLIAFGAVTNASIIGGTAS
ncbi:MAG: hypothetical protein WA741_28520 [Candidatus Sulfotelmatobacter sp.]